MPLLFFIAYDPLTGRIGSTGTHGGQKYLDALNASPDGHTYIDAPEGHYIGTHRMDLTDPEHPVPIPLVPVAATVTPLQISSGGSVTITTPELLEVYVDDEYVGSVPPGAPETLTLTGVGTFIIRLSPPMDGLVLPVEFAVVAS